MTRNRQLVRQLVLIRALLDAGRSGCTLGALAVAAEVTPRTIRRDIEALESAHLPIIVGRRRDDGVTLYGLMQGGCPTCGRSRKVAA